MIKSNLGKQIKRLRLYAGMTQEEFSKKVGVSRPTISSWEVDRTEPSMQDVQKMASVLGCSVNDIIGKYRDELLKSKNDEEQRLIAEYAQDEHLRRLILFAGANIPKDNREKFVDAVINTINVLNDIGKKG